MNKSVKTKNTASRAVIIIVSAIAVRWGILLLFSLLAYLRSDPGAAIPLFSVGAKLLSELICGIITAMLLNKNFSMATKMTLAAVISLIINSAELIIGKAFFTANEMNVLLMPFAVLAAAIGAMLVSRRKKNVRRRRRTVR